MDYHEYLKSDRWKFTAEAAKRRAFYRCQVCNSSSTLLNAHHRTYERLGNERDEDLTVLCRPCHELFHVNKRGQLPDPDAAWLAEVAAVMPCFYRAVIANCNCVAFADDAVVLVFGAEVPDDLMRAFNRDYVCGRIVLAARLPFIAGSRLRWNAIEWAKMKAELVQSLGE